MSDHQYTTQPCTQKFSFLAVRAKKPTMCRFFRIQGWMFVRTAFFIDGYNLFYGLLAGTEYKWLDLPGLLSHIARIENPAFDPVSFHYFTSPVQPKLSTRGLRSKEAQDTYIRALKATGVEVTLGRHRLDPAKAPRYVGKGTQPSQSGKTSQTFILV